MNLFNVYVDIYEFYVVIFKDFTILLAHGNETAATRKINSTHLDN